MMLEQQRIRMIAILAWLLTLSSSASLAESNKTKLDRNDESETLHVDRFGQDATRSWNHKVLSKEDINRIDVSEKQDLKKHGPCPSWDELGAWKAGPKQESSGFFGLKEIDGRWWLISPTGKLFYSLGIDCVGAGSFSPLRKERPNSISTKSSGEGKIQGDRIFAKYDWLPDEAGEFSQARKDNSVSFYIANLQRKWGANWRDKFTERVFQRMHSWNFNSLGNWSDDELQAKDFPFFSMGPSTWELKINYIDGDIPDVYDPRFENEAIRVCAKDFSRRKSDKWLVGYFLDNEMPWWNIPYDVLALDPKEPAKKAWLGKLKSKYGTVEKLNKAWGTKARTFDALRWTGDKSHPTAKKDMDELLGDFASRFYSAWYVAMKKADPNHLVLGSRIPYPMDEIVDACAKNTDVLSFNHYAADLPEKFDEYYKKYHKPMLIGEYDFDSLDEGLRKAFVPVQNQRQRAVGYAYYTEQAAAKPYMIGTHYFQYVDEPLTGRSDGESSFNGFVTVTDRPYAELVQAARHTNCRIYEIHSGKLKASAIKPR